MACCTLTYDECVALMVRENNTTNSRPNPLSQFVLEEKIFISNNVDVEKWFKAYFKQYISDYISHYIIYLLRKQRKRSTWYWILRKRRRTTIYYMFLFFYDLYVMCFNSNYYLDWLITLNNRLFRLRTQKYRFVQLLSEKNDTINSCIQNCK